MCSARASADTVINKSTVCVQSGLKYNSLCDKCIEIIHYITIYIGSQDNNNFDLFRKDWDAVPSVRILVDLFRLLQGPSVNKEYLSQIQLYSIFGELPVLSNTVVIITVCVKVANSIFLVTNKRTKWDKLSRYYLCNCFVR